VIVVIGRTYLHETTAGAVPGGLAGRVAAAAAAAGSAVELIAKVGLDAAGDSLLIALSAAGVGHATILRDAVHPTARRVDTVDQSSASRLVEDDVDALTEPLAWSVHPSDAPSLEAADVELALRYLTDYRVLAVVQSDDGVLERAIAAADWAGAHLVVVSDAGSGPPASLPPDSVVLSLAENEPDGSMFGWRLGAYLAAVDGGTDPPDAFQSLVLGEDRPGTA